RQRVERKDAAIAALVFVKRRARWPPQQGPLLTCGQAPRPGDGEERPQRRLRETAPHNRVATLFGGCQRGDGSLRFKPRPSPHMETLLHIWRSGQPAPMMTIRGKQ